jgi:hypothetical protein
MAVLSDLLLLGQLKEQHQHAFDKIVEAVANGTCNLFLGSAVHAPPPAGSAYLSPPGSLPPIGNQLADRLATESGYRDRFGESDITNLQRVSQFYEAKFGRSELEQRLFKEVEEHKRPSAVLRTLAQLDFRVIVTTNYDTLLQKALGLAGKVPIVSCYHANDQGKPPQTVIDTNREVTPDAPFLFKMHGDIQGFQSIVITEEDYIQFVLRFRDITPLHSIPLKVLEAIKSAPTLFIGYSLRDYNLRVWLKVLRKIVDDANFPANYSVDLKPDPVIFDVWYSQRRYVNFIAQNVWEFVPELYRRVKNEEMPA